MCLWLEPNTDPTPKKKKEVMNLVIKERGRHVVTTKFCEQKLKNLR